MKVFIIEGKPHVSTSTSGNYSKLIGELVNDHGQGFVFAYPHHKQKIGFSEFNDVELKFPRKLSVKYRRLCREYMTSEDILRLIDFSPTELQPQADGTFKYFTDVIKLEGEAYYYSIQDVTELYWNMIANLVKKSGNRNYEFPGKITIEVNSNQLKVKIEYK